MLKVHTNKEWHVALDTEDIPIEVFLKFLQENIFYWMNEQQKLEKQLEEL